MAGLADRLAMLVQIRSQDRQIARDNAADPEKDRVGGASSMLMIDLRFFGVADYFLKADVASFRSQLSECAGISKRLFERFENGEPVDASYMTMLSYQYLFDALAARDMSLAKSLAGYMGGRDEVERIHDDPFTHAMGYTLQAFVLDDSRGMRNWPRNLAAACQETKMSDFQGYVQAFDAIRDGDAQGFHEGLMEIVKGHKKQSKGTGFFVNTEDEILCVWGVGMANLARSRGLVGQAVPPLIPEDLLLGP